MAVFEVLTLGNIRPLVPQYHSNLSLYNFTIHSLQRDRQTERQTENTTGHNVVGQRNYLGFSISKPQHYFAYYVKFCFFFIATRISFLFTVRNTAIPELGHTDLQGLSFRMLVSNALATTVNVCLA